MDRGSAVRRVGGLVCGVLTVCSVGRNAHGAVQPYARFPVTARDVGRVNAGEKTRVSFAIENPGKAPLQIRSVGGDCGCLTPHYPKSVPAGGKASIDATLEAEPMWSGKIEKTMRVQTDDPAHPEISLKVTATVVPFVAMTPPSPIVLPFDRGKTYHQVVSLAPRSGSHLVLSNPRTTDPVVKARLVPPVASDRSHTYRLDLTVGPVKRQGDFSAMVKLATTEPHMPEAWVIVTLLANSGPVVSPSTVTVPTCSREKARQSLAHLQVYTRKGPMRLLGVETGNPALQADVKATSPGHSYDVTIRARDGIRPGRLKSQLRVRTDDRTTPVIEVPLDAVITDGAAR